MTITPPSVPITLALDLEGTLISNAMSQIPRPGLFRFLSNVHELFDRIVMFTTVSEERFRQIATLLVQEGLVPEWFGGIEYVRWDGATKDLNFVPNASPESILLADDFERYVHPGQERQWVQAEYFDYPYASHDTGLLRLEGALRNRLGLPRSP